MKNKTLKYLGLFFTTFTLWTACEDLDIENINQPDAERALSSDSDLISLLNGATSATFNQLNGFEGIHLDGLADQITSTNASGDFWGFTDQPRRAINNTTTNAEISQFGEWWDDLNSQIYNANLILDIINNQEKTIANTNGDDVTAASKTTALFIRGLSIGYLGMIYDKGYRVDENTDLTTLEFEDYAQLIGYGLADIAAALDTAPADYALRIHANFSVDRATFVKLANTLRAKIAMGVKRGGAADETINYTQVIAWLDAGITENFNPPEEANVFFDFRRWYGSYFIAGAGYLPVDQKIPFLAEGNSDLQPMDYPTDSSVILGPISNTTDSRIANYFQYVAEFGFLNPARGRHLFSNYHHTRYFEQNAGNETGLDTNFFTLAEKNYLKAEAQLLNGDTDGALATINTSAERAASGLPDATDPAKALLYEYAIELHLNGTGGTNWFFMRRHNLLQLGTPLHFPVPATELEISGLDSYTFGSQGGEASASGPGWKQ
ncbi:MAG: hypothetical protein ACPIA1_03860 [Flavobacteriaceae bacterium]